MKKLICSILSVILLTLSLSSCSLGCEHEWAEATCTAPKTCTLCGKTEGDLLPHDWVEATCESPKTCKLCGKTIGKVLGHDMIDYTCSRCGYKEWSVEDFGFYNLDICNTFLRISGYDLSHGEVGGENSATYLILKYYDNYSSGIWYYLNSDKKYASNSIYDIIDNDNIVFGDGDSLRIIDRVVVNEENNYVILKCLNGNNGMEWYISEEAIDWTKSPKETPASDKWKLTFYLKDQSK